MKHIKLFEDYPSLTPFFGMPGKPAQTVFNIIAESNSHKILKLAIEAAGLKATLSDTREQFTIFAPNDEAFKMLASGTLGITTEELLVNVEKLKEVLLYHCVKGAISSGDLKNNQVIETLQGGEVEVEMIRGDLFINSNETGAYFTGAEVIGSDLVAANGVVHVIDAVLIPEVEENI
jgi:uncharacterized surface protein with fasciclin (FAS1) repeats